MIVYDASKKGWLPDNPDAWMVRDNRIEEWVYGFKTITPEIPELKLIRNYGLSLDKQVFRKEEIPDYMYDVEYNEDGVIKPTPRQRDFRDRINKKRIHGEWQYINGRPTYIPGDLYFELNFFEIRLESGGTGVKFYRDRDRRREMVFREVDLDGSVYGLVYCKPRRDGATWWALAKMVNRATLYKNYFACMQANKDVKARGAFKMLLKAYKKLPWFLQPSKSSVADAHPLEFSIAASSKRGVNSVSGGLESSIDYGPSTTGHFDGEQINLFYLDEPGKCKQMNVNEQLDIIVPALSLGMGTSKIGNALLTTTVDDLQDSLANFKITWDSSNPLQINRSRFGTTESGLVRLFMTTYDGLQNFIGPHGESVIGEPTASQKAFLIKKARDEEKDESLIQLYKDGYGAYRFWSEKVASLGGNASRKIKFLRKYPGSEEDIFGLANDESPFDLEKLRSLSFALQEKPIKLRYFDLAWDDKRENVVLNEKAKDPKFATSWMPDTSKPRAVKNGTVITDMGEVTRWKPVQQRKGYFGADPFAKSEVQGRGSRGGLLGVFPYDTAEAMDVNMKMKGPAVWLYYCYRTRTVAQYFEDCVMAAHYFGFRIFPEDNTYGLAEHFIARGMQDFLIYPDEVGMKDRGAEAAGVKTNQSMAKTYFDLWDYFIDGDNPLICGPQSYDLVEEPWRCPFPELVTSLQNVTLETRTNHDDVMAGGTAWLVSAQNRGGHQSQVDIMDAYKGILQATRMFG
jgi:hypothetical protein